MRHIIEPEFTSQEKNALQRVVFALAACSWKQTDVNGFPDPTADVKWMQQEIERLESMISESAANISDGSIFWMRQIAVIQYLIDVYREELQSRTKLDPVLNTSYSKDKR
jgi:hypothetical protein